MLLVSCDISSVQIFSDLVNLMRHEEHLSIHTPGKRLEIKFVGKTDPQHCCEEEKAQDREYKREILKFKDMVQQSFCNMKRIFD